MAAKHTGKHERPLLRPIVPHIKRKKADIKKAERTMTVHHRRPLSLDGSTLPWNISRISEEQHKAWTIIAGNMNPEQICNHINTHFKRKGVTVICRFINKKPCTKTGVPGSLDAQKMSYAWRILFRHCPRFEDKINYINSTLLDPAYHFYIRE